MGDRGPHQAARVSVACAGGPRSRGPFRGTLRFVRRHVHPEARDGRGLPRALLDKDPHNAFLRKRLGNLFRGCGEKARSSEWYEKSLALDAGDIEARFHLYSFAVEDCDFAAAIKHAPLLVRCLLDGRQTDKKELTTGIALWVTDALRSAPKIAETEKG